MRHTEYGPLAFGISCFVWLQPFEKRAAFIVKNFFYITQPFVPLQHPLGRVASVPRYSDGRYAAALQFTFGCLQQEFCHSTATVRFAHPQRIDESVSFAIQGLVFGALGDEHLYAAMMLLVGNEYADRVFPMLMLYHR